MSKPTHRVTKRHTYTAFVEGEIIAYPSGSPCTPDADSLAMTPDKFEEIGKAQAKPKAEKKSKKEAKPEVDAADGSGEQF